MHKLLCKLMACLGLCAAACQDPGCIRNSECKSGYSCKDNKCVAPDAGAAAGGSNTGGEGAASGKSGSSGKAGASAGKSGSSASSGGSGSSAPTGGSN